MNEGDGQKIYYPALDGMRGAAILLVIAYHNFTALSVSHFGWLGVDLFFVLSGFLITGILLKSFDDPNWLQNFYIKRVLRIFPLYFASLIIFLFVLPALINSPAIFSYYIAHQEWLWFFLQNWLYIFKQPEGAGFLNHFWSLAVEEQFYLLWPFMMLALGKPKYILAGILTVLLAAICIRFYVWVQRIESLSYYSFYTFSRIDGICIGCAVALLQKIKPPFLSTYSTGIVLFFAAFNFGFYFVNSRYNFTFPYLAIVGYTTFAVLFGLLVHEGVRGKTAWINIVFNNSILHFFGKISFGLYVWHWPIFVLLNPEINRWLQNKFDWQNNFAGPLICTALAVAISVLSFYFFEKRFLSLKYRLTISKQN